MSNQDKAADKGFRSSVKQYVEAQHLSDEGLTRIEALLAGKMVDERIRSDAAPQPTISDPANTVNAPSGISMALYAAAASVLLLVAGYQLSSHIELQRWFSGDSNTLAAHNMSWKIANEVALNHVKMKPLEVQTQQLSELRAYFTQLDFTPVNSSFLNNSASKMLGGRYCSIQGLTAAQIRFSDNDKQLVTLYEVQYDPSLYGVLPILERGEQPTELVVRGVAVSIWVEKGLLMATARSVD
ncbi:hypothetical protein L2755_11960 [Shewanella abyssi]|uniref:hypothetical protein n=1 Tax=Shewanella abyssi TaxID=311789 RepID=UPI00200FB3A3|nr:hypothetical protein [Shewanella abyssi]MCL1050337.1 hypothetical protein [Shewanella abyssi]